MAHQDFHCRHVHILGEAGELVFDVRLTVGGPPHSHPPAPRELPAGTPLCPAIRDHLLTERVATDDEPLRYGSGVFMVGKGDSFANSVIGADPGVTLDSAWGMRQVVAAQLDMPWRATPRLAA